MINQNTLHESARAVALEAASRIIADTDSEVYQSHGNNTQQREDANRAQATLTMAHEFYRFIVLGDKQVS